jgi:DNA-directed RNA polymerase subunit beta'
MSSSSRRHGHEAERAAQRGQYRKAREEYGFTAFTAQMGAEAIKSLLATVDIATLAVELREKMRSSSRSQKRRSTPSA